MKAIKRLTLVLVLLLTLVFSINTVNASGNKIVKIFHLNDTHGAILEGDKTGGLAKISKYIKDGKAQNPNTLVISSGDMFQGTAISSMTRGEIMVDVMNEIGFDSMTIGNHEFDWGVDYITRYHDGNMENGEANFPFLACNIIEKSTNKPVSWAQPYAIFNLDGVKVGVIGSLDETCPNDIMASIVAPYTFDDQVVHIRKYAKELRNNGCDLVIVSAHSGETGNITEDSLVGRLAKLTGNEKIDFCFNSHSHYKYEGVYQRTDRTNLYYMQSGANGTYLGEVTLELNSNNEIVNCEAQNKYTTSLKQADEAVTNVINKYQSHIDLSNSTIGNATNTLYRSEGAVWAVNVLKEYTKADVAVVNYGGIRSNAFPIEGSVKYGDIFELSPFENMVIVSTLTGNQLNSISSNANTSNLYFSGDNFKYDSSKTYRVATIDYLFEKTSYPFQKGSDIERLPVVFREILIDEIKLSQETYGKWDFNKIYFSENFSSDISTIAIESVGYNFIKVLVQPGYSYSIDGSHYITSDTNVITFEGLTENTKYTISMKKDGESEVIATKVVSTSDDTRVVVSTPSVKQAKEDSLLINTVKGMSYSIDKQRWYDATGSMITINGLEKGTTYTLYYKVTGASDDTIESIEVKTAGGGFSFNCESFSAVYVALSSVALVVIFRKRNQF